MRRWASFAALSVAVSACESAELAATPLGRDEAGVVSQAEFERARTILDAIDYLPFEYRADGCYGRAFYMSMELAAQRIESNSIFVLPPANGRGLPYRTRPEGPATGFWLYHVAPVIEVAMPSGNVAFVADPSLATTPLGVDGWLARMDVTWDVATVGLLKGPVYGTLTRVRDMQKVHPSSWREELTRSFEDMPRFELADVQKACGAIHGYVVLEEASRIPRTQEDPDAARGEADAIAERAETAAAVKLGKLHARTRHLLDALTHVGKLTSSSDSFSDEACTKEGQTIAARSLEQ